APASIDLQNHDIDSATAPTTGPADPAAATAGSPTAVAGELSGNRTSMPETPRNPAPASIDLQNHDIDSATAPTAGPAAAVVSAATPAGTTTEAGDPPTEQEQR
ncbi:MAG: hypothetical protein VB093_15155, partial [Propionicimonas sp.]|nr:hypothetical protein [Propionicimonas sp.]